MMAIDGAYRSKPRLRKGKDLRRTDVHVIREENEHRGDLEA